MLWGRWRELSWTFLLWPWTRPKENCVLGELCMVCRSDSSCNFQTFKILIVLLLLQLSAHRVRDQDVEIWRQREALADAPRGLEELGWPTIYQRGNPGIGDARFNPYSEPYRKTKLWHDFKQKEVFYSIKSVKCIELYSHTLVLAFHVGVNCFLDNNDVVYNLSPSNKSSLRIWD